MAKKDVTIYGSGKGELKELDTKMREQWIGQEKSIEKKEKRTRKSK